MLKNRLLKMYALVKDLTVKGNSPCVTPLNGVMCAPYLYALRIVIEEKRYSTKLIVRCIHLFFFSYSSFSPEDVPNDNFTVNDPRLRNGSSVFFFFYTVKYYLLENRPVAFRLLCAGDFSYYDDRFVPFLIMK